MVKKREEDPIINIEPVDVIQDRIDIVHSDEIISSEEQTQGKQGFNFSHFMRIFCQYPFAQVLFPNLKPKLKGPSRGRFHQTWFAKQKVAGAHHLVKNWHTFCQICSTFAKRCVPKKGSHSVREKKVVCIY